MANPGVRTPESTRIVMPDRGPRVTLMEGPITMMGPRPRWHTVRTP